MTKQNKTQQWARGDHLHHGNMNNWSVLWLRGNNKKSFSGDHWSSDMTDVLIKVVSDLPRGPRQVLLTHWGWVTHTCVGKLTIIGSDNDLSPERRQAIIWTNAGILLFGPLETNFSEILIEIQTFSLKKIRLKMLSAKCCSFRLGLNVLKWS